MHQTTTDPKPLRRATAGLLWWADAIAVSSVALVGGAAALVHGEPVAVSVALFCVSAVCGTYAQRARREFRRGWRQGYETAARVMLEVSRGRTTDVHARAVVLGDPTPEPWDTHVPVRAPRRSR